MSLVKSIKFTIILFISVAIYATANNYPLLTDIVTDKANIFTPTELTALREKLKRFETATANQLVIVTIKSLNDESIESYALEVFNRNKLGQKNIDNGILILFSDADKKVRIEVGYGLEGLLTDVTSSRIIHDIMIPAFKNKQYYEGINLATDKIIELINNPTLGEEFNKGSKLPQLATFILSFFLVLFLSLIFASIYIGREFIIGLYKKSTKAYKGLLTGKIGLFYFPVILSIIILQQLLMSILIIAILSTIPFSYFAIMQDWPSPDFNFRDISITLKGLGLLFFFLLPVILAIIQIIKSKKSHFNFTLISNNKYMENNFPSSNDSLLSNNNDDDSDDDHFSGGGGTSGGGGSSGSW